MKISLFKIGLILGIAGIVASGFVFYQGEKSSQSFVLDLEQTKSLDLKLEESGVGFYRISVPELGDSVFVQIIDSHENILVDKKIETKMAVNYFDFKNSDIYTIRITNLSDHPILVDAELGDANISQMRYAGVVVLIGMVLMVISGYRRLKNYKIAQPDENIS